jgi:protease PrsW
MRNVLIVAGLMSLGYGLEMVIDLLRPNVADPVIAASSPVSPLSSHADWLTRATFWLVLASWLVALVAVATVVVRRRARIDLGRACRRVRILQVVTAAALLLPFVFFPVVALVIDRTAALVCVPSTAFALWGVRRMQRYRRIPVWLLLAAAGWGIFIASGFAGAMNGWAAGYTSNYFYNAGDPFRSYRDTWTGMFANAAIVEELGKAAGVAMVYVLLRRYVDDVVSGIVLGAAVGLGFNFTETIAYMGQHGGSNAAFQYWMRQSVGLMAAHTVFTATVGAAVGAARQLPSRRTRRLVVACGLLAAIGGHFASDVILQWFSRISPQWLAPGTAFHILITSPLLLLTMQGPYLVLLYVLLLRNGQRNQTAAITTGLHAEAHSGAGAVTEAEMPVLLNPAKRLWLQITVLRRYGPAAYRALARLHAAQYDLANQRWHQTRNEADDHATPEQELRELVLHRRNLLATATITPDIRPAEAPT